jgi:peptidoglycan lytic transglycosylase
MMIKILLFLLFTSFCFGEVGVASWYSVRCNHGTKTSSGQKLRNDALTCAHKKLKMGTRVKVTNLSNGKFVFLTVNDAGPYHKGRIVDVTIRAAKILDFYKKGITKVSLEIVN